MATYSEDGVRCVRDAPNALFVYRRGGDGADHEVWVPKSMLRKPNEVWQKGDCGTLVVASSYAEDMGWVARNSFTTQEIRDAVRRALNRQRSACLDDDEDLERVMEEIMTSIETGERCDPLCGQEKGHDGPHDNDIEPPPRNVRAQPIMELLLYPDRNGKYKARVTEEDGSQRILSTSCENELDALNDIAVLLGCR